MNKVGFCPQETPRADGRLVWKHVGEIQKGLLILKMLPPFLLSRNVVCFLLGKWFSWAINTAMEPLGEKGMA